jgi:solute carrier family 5 (sodium-coupled monocarboxylate transporter), member 8/12
MLKLKVLSTVPSSNLTEFSPLLQYLEKRFGKTARLSASLAYSTQMVFYMGIVLYAPALAFESVMGIDKNIAIVVIGITVIFYCCVGGMRAVL